MTNVFNIEFFEPVSLLLTWGPDIIGGGGAVIVLVAYVLLQINKLEAESFVYSFLNFLGSIMILISLFYSWNTAAAVVEIAWIIISFFGMTKTIKFPLLKLRKKTG